MSLATPLCENEAADGATVIQSAKRELFNLHSFKCKAKITTYDGVFSSRCRCTSARHNDISQALNRVRVPLAGPFKGNFSLWQFSIPQIIIYYHEK